MKVGLMVTPHYPRDRDPVHEARTLVEQARVAEAAGFDSLHAGEHFLSDDVYFDQFQTLSRFMEHTDEIRIATTVSLVPLHQPAFLAERTAAMDVFSEGRFIFGVGAGYKEVQFETAGVPRDERGARLEEGLGVVKAVWTDDPASFHGEHYQMDGVRSFPKPVQDPHPDVWVGGHAPAAVERAARLGDAWVMSPLHGIGQLEPAVEHYDDHLTAEPVARPIRRDVYVAETTERAREIAGPHFVSMYREIISNWGVLDDWGLADPHSVDEDRFLDELVDDGRIILGSPDEVVDQIEHLNDRLGVDYPVVRVQFPGMDHEEAVPAIRLFGDEVIPRLRET